MTMSRTEICEMLESVGFPLAYETFGEGPECDPPYMIYAYPQNSPFYADGVIYAEIDRLQINLYTRKKDLDAEKKVETVLQEYGFDGYRKSENCYPQENLIEIIYEMEVAINAE